MLRITTSRLGAIMALVAMLFGLATGSHAAERGAQAKPPIRVDADFPGGNIVVDSIAGDTVTLHQDLRDTEGNWFYWYFRVRGAAGRTLEFRFSESNPIGTRGPALSLDGGKTWSWLGTNAVKGKTFICAFPPEAREARFCFAIPYLESNLKDFLKRHRGSRNLKAETLCKTPKGRKVELLRLGRLDGGAEHCVLLTCRHHACEMIANYSLEGIMDEVLGETNEGRWLREHVEFFVVPFMDKDGVEEGDQGKNRKPHDHNRDYDGESRYASVRAVRELVTRRLGSRNVALRARSALSPHPRPAQREHLLRRRTGAGELGPGGGVRQGARGRSARAACAIGPRTICPTARRGTPWKVRRAALGAGRPRSPTCGSARALRFRMRTSAKPRSPLRMPAPSAMIWPGPWRGISYRRPGWAPGRSERDQGATAPIPAARLHARLAGRRDPLPLRSDPAFMPRPADVIQAGSL